MSGHTNTEHVFYCLNIYTVFPLVFNIITNYLSALSSKQKIGTKLKKANNNNNNNNNNNKIGKIFITKPQLKSYLFYNNHNNNNNDNDDNNESEK